MNKGGAKQPTELNQKSGQEKALPVQHVAIIMDGNRRWADLRGLPRLLGHREGVSRAKIGSAPEKRSIISLNCSAKLSAKSFLNSAKMASN